MKSQSAFRSAAIVAAIVGFSLVAAAKTSDSEQISIYMHQARVHAYQAAADLAKLQSYSMTGVPWQVDFNRLQHVQDDVNALAKDAQRLKALSGSATKDQLEAIDRVEQLTQSLAVRVKESLRYLDYNSAAVNMRPFTMRVNSQYASANEIFTILCKCGSKANKNAIQVASVAPDPTAISDCSNKSFVTKP